jgi:hypothetical protein
MPPLLRRSNNFLGSKKEKKGVSTQCSYDPSPFKLNVMSKSMFVLKGARKPEKNEVMDYVRLKFFCRTVSFSQSEREPAQSCPCNGNYSCTEWSSGLIYTQPFLRNESRHRKGRSISYIVSRQIEYFAFVQHVKFFRHKKLMFISITEKLDNIEE